MTNKQNKTNQTKKTAIAVENASAHNFNPLAKRKFSSPTEKAIPQPNQDWLDGAQTKYNEAQAARAKGDYPEAVRLYTEIIESKWFIKCDKEIQARTYYNRGGVYIRLNKPAEALVDYDKAIDLNPEYAKAYNNRGKAYDSLGKLAEALADYTKAIDLNPGYAEAYNNLGLILTEHRNHGTGMYDYNLTSEQHETVERGLEILKSDGSGVALLYSYFASTNTDEHKKNDWSGRAKEQFKKVFSSEALRPEKFPQPNKLYRFKPFNERVFDELKNQQLFLNDPMQWNDPFDGRMFANFRVPEFQHYFKRLRMQSFCVKRDQSYQGFPTDPLNNFLMWSHYADQHKGVCLEYEYQPPPQQAQETPQAFLHPVKYNNEPDLKVVHDFYLMKSEQWRYENEYRLVHMIEEGDDTKLKEPCLLDYKDIGLTLTSICFGSECSETRIEMIKAFIKETHREDKISLKQMKNDGVRFKLEYKEV